MSFTIGIDCLLLISETNGTYLKYLGWHNTSVTSQEVSFRLGCRNLGAMDGKICSPCELDSVFHDGMTVFFRLWLNSTAKHGSLK